MQYISLIHFLIRYMCLSTVMLTPWQRWWS